MWVVCRILQAFALVLFARVLLEWVPVGEEHPVGRARRVLRRFTQPVLAPVRAVVPPVRVGGMALDLSPVIVFLVISLASGLVC